MRRLYTTAVGILAFGVLLGGSTGTRIKTASAAPAPVEPVGSIARSARYAAALVEGTVDSVATSFDERHGPRTNFHLVVEKVYSGKLDTDTILISQFGGPIPSGHVVGASEVPMLSVGKKYLLMVANDVKTAFWSMIVDDYAFAVEKVNGAEVLVGSDGRIVQRMSVLGPRFGEIPLFEPTYFDGSSVPTPTRLLAVSAEDIANETDGAPTAAQAALAITQATAAEDVTFGGAVGSNEPPWNGFWNSIPVAQAPQQ